MEHSQLAEQLLNRQAQAGTWSVDESAINSAINFEQRSPVADALSPEQRRFDANHYNRREFTRLRDRPRTPGPAPMIDRAQLLQRIRTALQEKSAAHNEASADTAPAAAAAAAAATTAPAGVLARSTAWFGSLCEDLEQWDQLPCPATTADRANYVLSRDGRGAALLTLLLLVALIAMLVRAFV
jgi:hypothetical protein